MTWIIRASERPDSGYMSCFDTERSVLLYCFNNYFGGSMKKLLFVVAIVLVAAGTAFSACPNVVGDWAVTANCVYWESTGGTSGYYPASALFRVESQDGCVFYGTLNPATSPEPFIGVITNNSTDMTISAHDAMFQGNLAGFNATKGKYTKFKFTSYTMFTTITEPNKDFDSCQGSALRQ